jgi:D-alanine--poly(phosphoribitol) ligase subunit 2
MLVHGRRCLCSHVASQLHFVSPIVFPTLVDALCRTNPACDRSRISPSTPLLEEGLLDSLQIVTLIGELEKDLGCQVPLDEVVPENFQDLTAIGALVQRCLPGGATPAGSPPVSG